MNIDEVLTLDPEELEKIVSIIKRRKYILKEMKSYRVQMGVLQELLKQIQEYCHHPLTDKSIHPFQDEFGRVMGPSEYSYKCKDCEKHWRTDAQGNTI